MRHIHRFVSGNQERHSVAPALHGQRIGEGHVAHAGHRAHSLADLPQVFEELSRLGESGSRDRDARGDDVAAVETGVHLLEPIEAADQQSRAAEQHEGQRHFAHDQRTPKPRASASTG